MQQARYFSQCCFTAGPPSAMLAHHKNNIGSMTHICRVSITIVGGAGHQTQTNVVSMVGQRHRRWPTIDTTLGDRPVFLVGGDR